MYARTHACHTHGCTHMHNTLHMDKHTHTHTHAHVSLTFLLDQLFSVINVLFSSLWIVPSHVRDYRATTGFIAPTWIFLLYCR